MSIDVEQRLTALEAEARALRAENVALRSKLTELADGGMRKRVPPPSEPATRIVEPVATVKADSPNDEELKRLRAICANEYPEWCSSDGYVFAGRGTPDKAACDAEWLRQFSRSILALSAMRKLPTPDSKRYASSFTERAQTVLRAIGRHTSELRSAPFFMACFCQDVPVSGLGVAQCTVSLGLTNFEGVGSPIDPSAWRQTLKNGRLPAQHRVDRIIEQPSPARVYGGY